MRCIMAVKRMMNTNIINTDEFLSMPMSARLLYYDFCMRGDDDGFIDSPQKIMKMKTQHIMAIIIIASLMRVKSMFANI